MPVVDVRRGPKRSSSEHGVHHRQRPAGLIAGDADGEHAERQLQYFARRADHDVGKGCHRRSIGRNREHRLLV